MFKGDKEHIHFYNITEQAHVKESRQRSDSDPRNVAETPYTPHEPDYIKNWYNRYSSPPLLTLWEITYRILAQIPLPGQPLYNNEYNLPI